MQTGEVSPLSGRTEGPIKVPLTGATDQGLMGLFRSNVSILFPCFSQIYHPLLMLSLHFLNLTVINFLTLNVLVFIFFRSLVLFAMVE